MRRSHNDVDISQRTAAPPQSQEEENESFVKWLKEMYPYGFRYPGSEQVPAYDHIWGDPESERKLREILRDGEPPTEEEETQQPRQPFDGDDEFLNDPEKWNRSRKKL